MNKHTLGTECGASVKSADSDETCLIVDDGIGDAAFLTLDELVDLLPIIEQHLIENGR